MTLLVDLNEPDDIIRLIRPAAPVVVTTLNLMHMSDYYFAGYDGTRFQFSRKQTGELVGNLDEAEDQLRDYYDKADVNYQIVEGLPPLPRALTGVPVSDRTMSKVSTRFKPSIYTYRVLPDGTLKGDAFDTMHSTALLYAWLHRLDRAGISTYWTANFQETAQLLVAIYRNEQKPPEEHETLQRIIKPRIHLRDQDPFVKALMYLSAAYKLGIGEKTAKILAAQFANITDLCMASVEEIRQCPGIGTATAEKILRALGRTVE